MKNERGEKKARRARKGKPKKRQRSNDMVDIDENTCKICFVQYEKSDDENLPWMMCDSRQNWMHIECIPIGIDVTGISDDEQFLCHDCVDE